MTTTWKITSTDRHTTDGFIFCVHWTASQVDGDFTASTYSTVSFTKKDGINYVPYANLTEAAVIEWVKSSLGVDGVKAVDGALAQQIADQKAPKVAAGLPW